MTNWTAPPAGWPWTLLVCLGVAALSTLPELAGPLANLWPLSLGALMPTGWSGSAKEREDEDSAEITTTLLATAAHELREPLAALRFNLDATRRALVRGDRTEQLGPRVSLAMEQVDRLRALLDAVLEGSLLDLPPSSPIRAERIDLGERLRSFARAQEGAISKAGCELQLNIPEEVVGYWDSIRLEHILNNLLSNALKYGAGHPVTLALEPRGNSVVLSVSDQGMGLPEQESAKLFERYARHENARHLPGTGLGLWVVERATKALGGEVEVRSRPGQGACFRVTLPKQPPLG